MADVVTILAVGWLIHRFMPSTSQTHPIETMSTTNNNNDDDAAAHNDDDPLPPSEMLKQACPLRNTGACLVKSESGEYVADLPDMNRAALVIKELNKRMAVIAQYIQKILIDYEASKIGRSTPVVVSNATINVWARQHYMVVKNRDEFLIQIKAMKQFMEQLPRVTVSEKTFIKTSRLTSYTLDKKEVALCLRQNQNGSLYDVNTLMYVVVHEYAHVMSEGLGHDVEFINNFAVLLRIAIALKQYIQVDYSKRPVNYCGLQLNQSVLV